MRELIITCVKEGENRLKRAFLIAHVTSLTPEVDAFSVTSKSFLRKVRSAKTKYTTRERRCETVMNISVKSLVTFTKHFTKKFTGCLENKTVTKP